MPEQNDALLKIIPLLNSEAGQKIAREICKKHGFSYDTFMKLVRAYVEDKRIIRPVMLFQNFDDIFNMRNSDVD